MFKLEHNLEEQSNVENVILPILNRLKNLKDSRKDDYQISKKLRANFRIERDRYLLTLN
jgi:hypothetical protein